MPELPEVETMRRGVEPVVGAKILAAERLSRTLGLDLFGSAALVPDGRGRR